MDDAAYSTFESILGPENVSRDPAVLDAYIYQTFGGGVDHFGAIRPACVALPSSTEEVQAVTKACNRHGLRLKAHSTGWGAWNNPGSEGVAILDLRRMNRLLEINERDMYAVVEPYVIWGQLQAEILPVGLNCCAIGAGSAASPLASCTSVQGIGSNNVSMGYNNRNVLGVEWVLPDGEILRLGSLGSGSGWISGDGPGPSLRGVMRGAFGAFGGLGVFTRCAIRLYHWGGPPALPSEGIVSTEERLLEYPESIELVNVCFEDRASQLEAIARIGEAEIAYSLGLMERGLISLALGADNLQAAEAREKLLPAIPKYMVSVLLVSSSRRELEYQRRALTQIADRTGGKDIELLNDPAFRDLITLSLVKGGSLPAKGVFSQAGSMHPILCGFLTTRGTTLTAMSQVEEIKQRHLESGLLVDDRGEGGWGPVILDHGHLGYFENETRFEPNDPASLKAFLDLNEETVELLIDQNLGNAFLSQIAVSHARGQDVHDVIAPAMNCDYRAWQRKFKQAFDPNDVADSTGSYIEAESGSSVKPR